MIGKQTKKKATTKIVLLKTTSNMIHTEKKESQKKIKVEKKCAK